MGMISSRTTSVIMQAMAAKSVRRQGFKQERKKSFNGSTSFVKNDCCIYNYCRSKNTKCQEENGNFQKSGDGWQSGQDVIWWCWGRKMPYGLFRTSYFHISVATSVGAIRVPLAHSTLPNIRISWSWRSTFMLVSGGSLSLKTTPVQAHRGFRLLTLAS